MLSSSEVGGARTDNLWSLMYTAIQIDLINIRQIQQISETAERANGLMKTW
jgi:hypothetical protein